MKHEERIKVAKEIVNKIMKKYRKDILVGGIFGSVARGNDNEFSDLEMIFVVKDNSKLKPQEFFYKGVPMSYDVEKMSEVKRSIDNIDLAWSLRASRYSNFKIICGNRNILDNLYKRMKKISDKKIRIVLSNNIPHLIGMYNKIKSDKLLNEIKDAIDIKRDILYMINLGLGLLNKKVFTRNFYLNFKEAYEFEKLPKNYEKFIEELWLSYDIDKTIKLLDILIKNYLVLLKENGIENKNVYNSLDEIKV